MTPASLRRALLAVGVVGCAYGLVAVAVPAAAVPLPLSTPVVAAVGLAAFAAAAVGGMRRVRRPRPLPVGDGPEPYPAPGDDWRARLAATSAADEDAQRALRDDLAASAVAALAARGTPPETARDRVERGVWTDDPLAAAYLRGDPPSLAERIRAVFGGDAPFRRRARRTMAAVAAIREVDE
ncbi:DUF7269 family protein [Halobaculum sp. P14]|uniref:DUF7269 family protein n=1 Tax=Halobaculum sp. P14 TaxID=3421638 RepID=UPI003EBEB7AF